MTWSAQHQLPLVYDISDVADNLASTVIRTVKAFDDRPPTITLLGDASIIILEASSLNSILAIIYYNY